MDRRLLQRAFQTEYRKRGFLISFLTHVIVCLICSFFFINAQIQETEDEIHVELIEARSRKNKTLPIPKKEPEPPKEEPPKQPEIIPIQPEKTTLIKQKRTMQQKQGEVKQTEHPAEIPKMQATKTETEHLQPNSLSDTSKTEDVPIVLETPDLSTDADLTPTPDSVLAPIGGETATAAEKSVGRRKGTYARTTGTKKGLSIGDPSTGTAKTNGKGNTNSGKGDTKYGGTNSGNGDTFSSIIQQITDDIIQSSAGAPIDVVFVVDASGSMQDNINAVAEHLGLMIDAYKASEIDYQLGLTDFFVDRTGNQKITVSPLTTSLQKYKQMLYAIIPTGDENALDAIHQTVTEMQFRPNTVKHFILVTDEPFTSKLGETVDSTINLCRQNEIYVNVLGLNMPQHKRLAEETDGTFHAVPQDPKSQILTQQPKTVQDIGQRILRDAANLPTDIILFVDTSKSMESKMDYITQQINMWRRSWDNAMIDYRIGVVRYRAKGSVNIVNVYNPPQTQQQIHKILEIPTQNDENLFHAVIEAIKRIKTRPNAKTHFILITDEPGNPKQTITGTILMLNEKGIVVSVIGTIDTFQQQVAQQTGGIWVEMPNAHKKNETYH